MNRTFRGRRRPVNAAAVAVALACPVALFAVVRASSSDALPAEARRQQPAQSRDLLSGKPTMMPTSAQVKVANSAAPGVVVTIEPGADAYPGVQIKPAGPSWDLSPFGHVEARIVNTGAKPLTLSLRVDNAGDWRDNPWNTETVTIAPGAEETVSTIFGFAYGEKPGYALDPKAVVNILFFAAKSDAPQSFRIATLAAAGPARETPPVNPASVRVRPANGDLLGGGAISVQVTTAGGAQGALATAKKTASKAASQLQITLPADASNTAAVSVRPATGRWDLRNCLEVRVRVRNTGKTPLTPRVRVDSDKGARESPSVAAKPLAPGATTTLAVSFVRPAPVNLGKPETLTPFASDAVSDVTLGADGANATGANHSLVAEAITAVMPPPVAKLPDGLGVRPPAPGEWVKTLDENFDGTALNTRVWDSEGENYYDKTTHWSKNNVVIGGGVARLRYEKKTGFHNDDPAKTKTDYAAGYLNTYGRWTQRYGYFESRMKLPQAPGLWPAFWMMPERGVAVGPEQWKRQDTANGGMEFDIMEHLTRWGPTRYNITMHYDGYGKEHKSIGSDAIYVQPDKDGFITTGLLWTPGLAVYYCNGREVLRWENPRIANVPSSLMFTLPSGGWDNDAINDARLPADFVIDYVRVWQRKDLADQPK